VLRKITLCLLGTASGFPGLVFVIKMLYNFGGVFKLQDSASGPRWESALVTLACAALAFGAFFSAYRLIRLTIASSHDPSK
jgi:hypothetical protein